MNKKKKTPKPTHATHLQYIEAYEFWSLELIELSKKLGEINDLTLGQLKAWRRRIDRSLKNCKILIRRLQVIDPLGERLEEKPSLTPDTDHYRFLYEIKVDVLGTIEEAKALLERNKREAEDTE